MKTKMFALLFFVLSLGLNANGRVSLPTNEWNSPLNSLFQMFQEQNTLYPDVKNWANLLGSVEDEFGTRLSPKSVRQLRGKMYLRLNEQANGPLAKTILQAEQELLAKRNPPLLAPKQGPNEKTEPDVRATFIRGESDHYKITIRPEDSFSFRVLAGDFRVIRRPNGIELYPMSSGEIAVEVVKQSGKKEFYNIAAKTKPHARLPDSNWADVMPYIILIVLLALLVSLLAWGFGARDCLMPAPAVPIPTGPSEQKYGQLENKIRQLLKSEGVSGDVTISSKGDIAIEVLGEQNRLRVEPKIRELVQHWPQAS